MAGTNLMTKIIFNGIFFLTFCSFSVGQKQDTSNSGPPDLKEPASSEAITLEEVNALKMERENKTNANLPPSERERFSYLRATGVDESTIFVELEQEAIKKGFYDKVDTLDEWVAEYSGIFLNEPSYNLQDEWIYDFSSPMSSLHSYWHAYYKLDIDVILKHSDPAFLMFLEKYRKTTLMRSPPKYANDGMSKITPLLTGKCVMEGKEYVVIVYRREFPENPKVNYISLHWDYFVFLNGKYYFSNAPSASQFGRIYATMGMLYIPSVGKYDFFAQKLKNTHVPRHFYTIDE